MMWVVLTTKQIFLSIILYCKFILTQQKPNKPTKLYDDYHQPIFIHVPKDIITKRHPQLPRINSVDLESQNFHANQFYSNHDELQPKDDQESLSDDSRSYSSYESESEPFSDSETEPESEPEVKYHRKNKEPKRKPGRKYVESEPEYVENYPEENSPLEEKYETFQEPSEFEHLSQRLHDPNGLLVKVYRGPTIYRSKDDPSKEPFASFGYYIKYPDS